MSGDERTADGVNEIDAVRFGPDGLVPAIVQDATTGEVLMLAYMNRESLERTLSTGRTCFWSRSRKALWVKGETSGNYQDVTSVHLDCDRDALLVRVRQTGVACHTGHRSCFFTRVSPEPEPGGRDAEAEARAGIAGAEGVLSELYGTICDRKRRMPAGSYTASLMSGGKDRILKKVAEEAGEVMLASKNDDREEIVREMADLWYHSLVVLGYHDIPPRAVCEELAKRRERKGKEGPA